MDIAAWCRQHPRSGLYLRQVDLPGVHTKFIEAHRGTLIRLLDLALSNSAVDRTANGASRFDVRDGFCEKPAGIRFRILDEANTRAFVVSSQRSEFVFRCGDYYRPRHGRVCVESAKALLFLDR